MSEGKRWRLSGENWLFDDHDKLVLWYTIQDDCLHGSPEDKILIAAAPDMIEALEEVYHHADMADDTAQMVLAAISKAKGINPDE